MGADQNSLVAHHPAGAIPLPEHPELKQHWPDHLTVGERVKSHLDCCQWTGTTARGEAVTVLIVPPEFNSERREKMLAPSVRLLSLQGKRDLEGVLQVQEIDQDKRWMVFDGASCGDGRDVHTLDWRLDRKLEFFFEVATAMANLHSAGVVHGCLAPRNIWLDEELRPQLAAIGLAKHASEILRQDPAVGYEPFLAPETLGGKSAASTAADVYALGRLLHFLLCGGDPPREEGSVPELEDLAHTPAGLSRIVRRCTLRDPAQRYGCVRDLINDVERYGEYTEVGVSFEGAVEANVTGLSNPTALLHHVRRKYVGNRAAKLAQVGAGLAETPSQGKVALALLGLTVLIALAFLFTPWVVVEKATARRLLASDSLSERAQAVERLTAAGEWDFDGVVLDKARLSQLNLSGGSFIGASFVGTHLDGTNLGGADLREANVSRAIITAADLTDVESDGLIGLETAFCDEGTALPEEWTCSSGHPALLNGLSTADNRAKGE